MFILPAVICELSNPFRKEEDGEAAERQQRHDQPGPRAGPVVGRIFVMDYTFYSGAVMLAVGWVVSWMSTQNNPYPCPPPSGSDL